MLLDFKRPPYQILESIISHTGKYRGFLGTHYHKGIICHVVGAVNKQTGEVIARHYNEKGYVNDEHAKSEAQKAWRKFSAGLVRKPSNEDLDAESTKELQQWVDRYEQRLEQARLRKRSSPIQ